MKNYEKYADEIREYEGNDFCAEFVRPHILKTYDCVDIDCGRCGTLQILWLLEEYEEPKELKEPETDWNKVKVHTPILVKEYEREEMNNKQERETMEEERMENLIEASRQVVEILQKNFHPHTTVVIEVDRIRVEETVEARVIEYAVD